MPTVVLKAELAQSYMAQPKISRLSFTIAGAWRIVPSMLRAGDQLSCLAGALDICELRVDCQSEKAGDNLLDVQGKISRFTQNAIGSET